MTGSDDEFRDLEQENVDGKLLAYGAVQEKTGLM